MPTPLEVLFEDNHCLAVAKPAGLLMVGDETGDDSLLDLAKDYLREKYNKPGNVFLGVVHRLDRPVSGVALFARTSKAASRLSDQFRVGSVQKVYRAWVKGSPPDGTHELVDWLKKTHETNTTRVVRAGTEGAKQALLRFSVLQRSGGKSLVEVHPKTGRSHQIRVQLSSRGWPILGDLRYGGPACGNPQAIALHATSLTFLHPTLKTECGISREFPTEWADWFEISVG